MRSLKHTVDVHSPSKHEGKPEWPNMLTVEMDRRRAIRLIAELAAQLECEDTGEPVTLILPGQTRRWNEEALTWDA